ncbi:hypothetical protein [Streptomyces anulatus]|uniref:hypothetical protein n=1 Tax=Streptomyces anulatus TaxID=1892 RepID=UPI0036AB5563
MARGILVELLSRPDGWETTADEMWRESLKRHGKASPGRRAFRAAFAELKTSGYLSAEVGPLGSGQHGTILTLRDLPPRRTEVPHAGTSDPDDWFDMPEDGAIDDGSVDWSDVPHAGTSAPPGETGVSADGSDVPLSDVPHAGTSNRRRSKNTEEKKTGGVADAVGKGAGGFARATATDSPGDESGQADGGCAASEETATPKPKKSPRPRTTKTRPRSSTPAFEAVRAAIPSDVARPGTALYPGLHRAINDLLTGNPAAGIPARTVEQVIARVNRRWFGENADARSAGDYRGCDRCTASGCDAVRRCPDAPEGCDRIKNRNAWLAAAILAQDCPRPSCEDGQLLNGGASCPDCRERREEQHQAERAAAEAAARMQAHMDDQAAAAAVVDTTWKDAEAAEEHRVRSKLAEAGAYGVKLDHHVHQHMTAWRDRNPDPRPAAHDGQRTPQVPVQGTFLMPWPSGAPGDTAAPHAVAQRSSRRKPPLENCEGCDRAYRPLTPGALCATCRTQQQAVSYA